MGFIDLVGIASNYIKQDFQLSDTVGNLILMMVYIWFVLFSIPTGILMSKIGRRKTVFASIVITAIALFIPIVSYNFVSILLALAMLGIGNAMLQVSLNPLVGDIVPGSKLASSLTFGQFVKAISSFLGPVLSGAAALYLGNWRYLFPLFGGISVLAAVWINVVNINETENEGKKRSFKDCFQLLNDRTILGYFIGIMLVVGIDVGLNVSIPKYLMAKANLPLAEAGLGISLYFVAKAVGAFFGAILLSRIPANKFYTVTVVLALISLAFTLLVSSLTGTYIGIFLLGITIANIFSIIFSKALQHKPDYWNEISGLMMMGIIGGAIVPLAIGIISDNLGQTTGMLVLGICMVYLLINSISSKKTVTG
ncbi:MAG: MFS transporter [Bacteroidetes bacterium]|nr:MFS transporter [Bacteroidota bacterium]